MRIFRKFCFGAAAVVWSICAQAALVTVTFDDVPRGMYYENVTSSAFTISPSCHIDIMVPAGGGDQQAGWDSSGCGGGGGNPDYLGPRPNGSMNSYLYIELADQRPFSFLSFDHRGQIFELWSSKGGHYDHPMCLPWERDCFSSSLTTFVIDGPDWTGVRWILFGYMDPGAPAVLLDNLVFRVAEPATALLVPLALLATMVRRRRSVSSGRADLK